MIKQNGGIFGRNPTYENVEIENNLTVENSLTANADGSTALYVNRNTNDGEIVQFQNSGNSVGAVSCSSADLVIYSTQPGHCGLRFGNTFMAATNNAGVIADNAISLGLGSFRFSEVFAGVGTINTSDENEKQDIRDLSSKERAVANRLKNLIKAFKFKSSVESKGDAARIHVGVIAQDVRSAFEAEELDANHYGMFCSDTWWTDADGKIYEQAEDGLTEHTRLGVRYDQLLAFIISVI